MRVLLIAVAVAACADAPIHHDKPTAPVKLQMTQRSLGGGDYEVTLTARPTRDVDTLDLVIDGRTQQLGPVRAGEARVMTAHVHLVGSGRIVTGGAAVRADGKRRTAGEEVRIGSEPVQRAARIVTLPDGTRVEESRP